MTWEQWGQEVAKTIDLCRTNEAMRLFGLELQAYLKRNPKPVSYTHLDFLAQGTIYPDVIESGAGDALSLIHISLYA